MKNNISKNLSKLGFNSKECQQFIEVQQTQLDYLEYLKKYNYAKKTTTALYRAKVEELQNAISEAKDDFESCIKDIDTKINMLCSMGIHICCTETGAINVFPKKLASKRRLDKFNRRRYGSEFLSMQRYQYEDVIKRYKLNYCKWCGKSFSAVYFEVYKGEITSKQQLSIEEFASKFGEEKVNVGSTLDARFINEDEESFKNTLRYLQTTINNTDNEEVKELMEEVLSLLRLRAQLLKDINNYENQLKSLCEIFGHDITMYGNDCKEVSCECCRKTFSWEYVKKHYEKVPMCGLVEFEYTKLDYTKPVWYERKDKPGSFENGPIYTD